MYKAIGKTIAGVALSVAAIAGFTGEAQAQQQCREYTRTVHIGNRAQEAYGTACLQPDGSWMIVGEGLGNDIPDTVNSVNYVIRDNNRYITPNRVVYYDTRPTYYRQPSPVFIWSNNSNRFYRNGHYVNYRKLDRHDHRRWDRHDNHRGRGHDHGRGRGHWRD